MLSAPDPAEMVLPLKTEIESESSPAAEEIELPARVRAAITVSLPPAATTVAAVPPLARDSESEPSAKSISISLAEALKTTVSLSASREEPP